MTIPFRRSLCRGVVLLALVALIAGCSGQSTVESFYPSADTAEDALTAALTAWQNGEAKPGPSLKVDKVRVEVHDDLWEGGAKLKSFEIVDEVLSEGPRKFSVKLTLEGDSATKDITYVILGKDPLIVMSENQFNHIGDM